MRTTSSNGLRQSAGQTVGSLDKPILADGRTVNFKGDPRFQYFQRPDESLVVWPKDPASGDDDAFFIQSAYNWTKKLYLVSESFGGIYRVLQQPIALDSTQVLRGSGLHSTTIVSHATSNLPAMIQVGAADFPTYVSLSGFQVFGNAHSGYGVQWRGSSSNMRDVVIQSTQLAGLYCDPETLGGSASDCEFKNVFVTHPGTDGVYLGKFFDSDLYNVICDGGTSGDSVAGSSIGFNCSSLSSNNRLHGCHAFLFVNGGMNMAGTEFWMGGGELESNGDGTAGTADLILNGGHRNSYTGVSFYQFAMNNPPAQEILFTNSASDNDISQCIWTNNGVVKTAAFYGFGTGANTNNRIRACPNFNPLGALSAGVPSYTTGSATANPFPFEVMVFLANTTGCQIGGVSTGGSPTMVILSPSQTIQPSDSGGGSWKWFGM